MKRKTVPSPVTILQALADAVRLRVLLVLEREELSVGELADVLQIPQSTTSRHLKVLGDTGLLKSRAAGPAMLFRLVLDDLPLEARALWLAVRGQTGDLSGEDLHRLAGVLSERRLDAQSFFGRAAGEWDEMRTRLFGGAFTMRALLGLLPPRWVVADLGCGTGNVSELLSPVCERVVAVDTNETMLAAARKRLADRGHVEFVRGGLEKLPLTDGSVDAAVSVLVLPYVERPRDAIAEMRRILRGGREGGVALIVDMVEHGREEFRTQMGHLHLGFAMAEVEGWMKQAGFARVSARRLEPEAEARGPGLFVATGRLGG